MYRPPEKTYLAGASVSLATVDLIAAPSMPASALKAAVSMESMELFILLSIQASITATASPSVMAPAFMPRKAASTSDAVVGPGST